MKATKWRTGLSFKESMNIERAGTSGSVEASTKEIPAFLEQREPLSSVHK